MSESYEGENNSSPVSMMAFPKLVGDKVNWIKST